MKSVDSDKSKKCFAFYSDKGGRHLNEDSVLALTSGGCFLFAVADGLGGHDCGNIASGIVKDNLDKLFLDSPEDFNLQKAIISTNSSILNEHNRSEKKMQSTVSAVYINRTRTVVANVGDSRTYLFKGNKEIFRSIDHSVAQMAVISGEITQDQIREYGQRNVLTRSLGSDVDIKVDVNVFDNNAYDRIIVCSDGFWEHVLESQMKRSSFLTRDPEKWIKRMRVFHDADAPINSDNNSAVVFIKSVRNRWFKSARKIPTST